MKLWQKGLLTIFLGALTNAVLIKYEIGGLVRELARLTVLGGFGLVIWGVIKIRNHKKTKIEK